MAQTFTGRKRVRKFFGKIEEIAEMPNLIEVQKASYDQFLLVKEPPGGRPDEGLQAVFKSVFPISDFSNTAQLEFVRYEFEPPKYDVDECRQRGMTYAAPLKVTLRLIVFDIDEETGARSVKDIKEQDVYMGDIPLMTNNGTFIVNGTERVIVSQMHRSPGVFFDHDKGKTHSSGKLLFAARIIPYRGSWLDIEFDAKDIVYARIDRRRKIPVTSLLFALGMDGEEILNTFYKQVIYKRSKDGWRVPFDANRMRGYKAVNDLVDADSGKVVVEAGKKMTVRQARQLAEKGLRALRMTDEELIGHYVAEDLVNTKTGEIYVEAGGEITEKMLKTLHEAGYKEIPVLDIDHVNVGAYIRNTLQCRQEHDARRRAVRHLPGHAPRRAADGRDGRRRCSNRCSSTPERYDLSAVGRVKMNMRLDLQAEDTLRVLRKEDIIGVIRTLVDLRDGKGEIDDIDHLGNRRVRSVGELMENQYRIGLLRMERAIKERMSLGRHRHRDAAGPRSTPSRRRRRCASSSARRSSPSSWTRPTRCPRSPTSAACRRSGRAGSPASAPASKCATCIRPITAASARSRRRKARTSASSIRWRPMRASTNTASSRPPIARSRTAASPMRSSTSPPWRRGAITSPRPTCRSTTRGRFTEDLIVCRHAGDVLMVAPDRVDYMDVSPKQLVSVAAALIPFLENDDANRALMGSNMQRQAVPLVRAEAPFVGTGMEGVVARDSGAAIAARRTGDHRPGRRHPHRGARDRGPRSDQVGRRHLPADEVPALQPEHLHQPAPAGEGRRRGEARATSSPTAPRPISASWRSAATCSSPSCRGTATTSRTRSCSPSASSRTTSSPRSISRNSR